MDTFLQDLRYTLRTLGPLWRFTFVAVLTLAMEVWRLYALAALSMWRRLWALGGRMAGGARTAGVLAPSQGQGLARGPADGGTGAWGAPWLPVPPRLPEAFRQE